MPLFDYLGLGIVLFSYAGKLCWGFNADWDLVPDLHDVVQATEDAFEELRAAARRRRPRATRRRDETAAAPARRSGSAGASRAGVRGDDVAPPAIPTPPGPERYSSAPSPRSACATPGV